MFATFPEHLFIAIRALHDAVCLAKDLAQGTVGN